MGYGSSAIPAGPEPVQQLKMSPRLLDGFKKDSKAEVQANDRLLNLRLL